MKYTLMAILGVSLLLPMQNLPAQDARRTSAAQGQDLWGTWRDGFQTFEQAEKDLKKNDFDRALAGYRESLQLFRAVRKINPDWNKGVISYRIDLCLRRIRYTQEKQDAATAAVKQKTKPQTKKSVEQNETPQPKRHDFVQEAIKARTRLAEAEKEIITLKRSIELNSKASQQVQDLIREKNELMRKNAAVALLLENTKAQLAKAGKNADKDRRIVELRSQLTKLHSQIRNMNVDMETLKMQKAEAQSKRNEAELALRTSNEKIASLTAAVEASKIVQKENRVLTEQLVQMKTDKRELENKLAEALGKVRDLSTQIAKIREGIDLPENIRKIQDHANIVLKDNEYLRTLNEKNMKEMELLKKSNTAATLELKKTTELYLLSTREYTKVAKEAADAGVRQAAAEREAAQTKNNLELIKRERDNLKTELAEFAKKYETLLKNANRTDALSAELLKRDDDLKKLSAKTAQLDLASEKLRQENNALLAKLTKTRENAQKTNSEQKNRYDALKKSTDKLTAENLALIASAEALRASLAKSEALNQESVRIGEENSKLKKEVAALNAAIQNLKNDDSMMRVSRENTDLKKQAALLQLKLQNAEKETLEKTTQYQELQRRADVLRSDFNRLSEERKKLAQANQKLKLNAKTGQITSAKYNEAVANNNRLAEEYQKLKKEFDSFREAVSKANSASFSSEKISVENVRLKKEAEELRSSLASLKEETEQIRKQSQTGTQALSAELQKTKSELQVSETALHTARKDLQTASAELQSEKEKHLAASAKLEEARRKQALAESGLAASLTANAAQVKLNEELKQEIASLKKSAPDQTQAQDGTEKEKYRTISAKLEEARKKQALAETGLAASLAANAKQVKLNEELKQEIASLKQSALKQTHVPDRLDAVLKENATLKEDVALLKGTVDRLLKQSDSVSGTKQALTENANLKSDVVKLRKHIEELSAELRKNEQLRKSNEEQLRKLQASGQNSEAFLKQRDELIRKLNEEIRILKIRTGKGTDKEIAELAATVTELREGKAQFETALRTLNDTKTKLEKENQNLRAELNKANQQNDSLRKTIAAPKPQGKLERSNLALIESASKFEKLYQQSNQERLAMAERLRKLDAEMKKSKQELASSSVTIERMRKELQEWADDPADMNGRTLRDKESAIDALAKENLQRRNEIAKLKSQLASSRESVRRYQEKMIAMEKRFQVILASIQDYKNVNTHEVLSAELKRQQEALEKEKQEELIRTVMKKKKEKQKKPIETAKKVNPVKQKPPVIEEFSPAEKKRYEESMRLAEKAEKNKDTAGALMNYWRAADANPKSAEAHGKLARIYLERGETTSAAKAYEKSIQLGAKPDPAFETKLKEGN